MSTYITVKTAKSAGKLNLSASVRVENPRALKSGVYLYRRKPVHCISIHLCIVHCKNVKVVKLRVTVVGVRICTCR